MIAEYVITLPECWLKKERILNADMINFTAKKQQKNPGQKVRDLKSFHKITFDHFAQRIYGCLLIGSLSGDADLLASAYRNRQQSQKALSVDLPVSLGYKHSALETVCFGYKQGCCLGIQAHIAFDYHILRIHQKHFLSVGHEFQYHPITDPLEMQSAVIQFSFISSQLEKDMI
jgi:hypothetical protein